MKPGDYIASRMGTNSVTSNEILNYLPIEASKRFELFALLHNGDEGQQERVHSWLWEMFEGSVLVERSLHAMLTGEDHENPSPNVVRIAGCMVAGNMAMRNGFGLPVLMSEVQLCTSSIKAVEFCSDESFNHAWASSKRVGVWAVVPGDERLALELDDPCGAPQFVGKDGSLVAVSSQRALVSPLGDGHVDVLDLESPEGERATIITDVCLPDDRTVLIGLAEPHVLLVDRSDFTALDVCSLDPGENESSAAATVQLWRVGQGVIAAAVGRRIYRIAVSGDASDREISADPYLRITGEFSVDVPIVIAVGGGYIAHAENKLVYLRMFEGPGPERILETFDPVDGRFTALAVGDRGHVVAATCESYLHVWRRSNADDEYFELPRFPQWQASSVAVSPDGTFVAVGTKAGSVVVYRLRELGSDSS